MKKHFSSWGFQCLGFALIAALTFGCSDQEEPIPKEIKDSLYFEFTLGGNKYKSEIIESDLIPQSGNEKIVEGTNGMNFLMYARFSSAIWMNFSNTCGTTPGRDCLDFMIQVPDTINEGSYPSLFTFGISVNGQQFVQKYNGPKVNDLPAEFRTDVVITKYDEVKNIVEGTVKGQFYKFQDPSEEVFYLTGEFRVYLFTN
ncbi:hypothetical protein [Algoriphagus machipongonensis]|uniref:Lipoprotein n=1 Tax=Algoriphagus machipongonensis TaxID=388413 RepID=A3I1H3_9BACT|nr:hypothetical protein [Algoriphagus machipongonensis]EAZ79639.1 hypothetical protein ALPR1_08443 [Algoriphagus machipongonensis]